MIKLSCTGEYATTKNPYPRSTYNLFTSFHYIVKNKKYKMEEYKSESIEAFY